MMTAAQAKVSYWQTTQYNARMEAKVTQ